MPAKTVKPKKTAVVKKKVGGKINPNREEVISEYFTGVISQVRTRIRQLFPNAPEAVQFGFSTWSAATTQFALTAMSA